MRDLREEILSRIMALLQAVPNTITVWRNRGDIPPPENLPALVLLDGDEKLHTNTKRRNITAYQDSYYTLMPQVFVLIQPRDTLDNLYLNEILKPIGIELSAWRLAVNRAILLDETLIAMVENGQIDYTGYETDQKSGSTIGAYGAQMLLHYEITYPLRLEDIEE